LDYAFQELQTILDQIVVIENALNVSGIVSELVNYVQGFLDCYDLVKEGLEFLECVVQER